MDKRFKTGHASSGSHSTGFIKLSSHLHTNTGKTLKCLCLHRNAQGIAQGYLSTTMEAFPDWPLTFGKPKNLKAAYQTKREQI